MELTRKQLETILLAHHRIHPDKQTTFLSRLKTLQRMGFPPGTNVGRGPKMVYTADHLMMLVCVFELQQFGLPAERAIITVKIGWDYLKVGFGVAIELQDQFKPHTEKILGQIFGRALKELQFEPDIPGSAEGIPFALAITATQFARQISRPSGGRFSYGYVLLDLSDIVQSVRSACVNVGGVKDTDFGLELSNWATHNGGYIRGGHPLKSEEENVLDPEA